MRKIVCIAWLFAFVAAPAGAYFDRLEVGGRAVAMAKTFHALADDPSAVYWNPAGFAGQRRASVLLTHYRPYVVEDLSVSFAALAFPLPPALGTAGIGWHHTGVTGVVSEDLFLLSLARSFPLPALGGLGVG
ncbi:MAG: hypothetical protein ABIH26_10985, partial [Candidatus Eisenbacteria bacterium]